VERRKPKKYMNAFMIFSREHRRQAECAVRTTIVRFMSKELGKM
jgi:hypothetical protein